uniref:Uncharacterized protein n=1 Tax=viral metagenome TaxID=1070528 RepID=A0A6C0EYX6_9ZZZZ
MPMNKLNNLIEKYELTNIIKVIIILLILYLAYRLFTSTNEKFNNNNYGNGDVIEGFANITNGTTYGNVISLLNKNNTPNYSKNTCTFQLDGNYRIDSLQFVFNSNANVTPSSTLLAYSSTLPISIQYVDPNNIKHDIKATASIGNINSGSPITYTTNTTSPYTLQLSSITDQFNKIIFTSQIILTIGESTNNISTYIDSTGNGYISKFGIFGGSINLPILADYDTNRVNQKLSALAFTSTTPISTIISSTLNSSVYNFTNNNDQLIYALQFDYNIAKTLANSTTSNATTTTSNATTTTNASILPILTTTVTPFYINITYTNSIYPGQNFAINNVYNVRSDANRLQPDSTNIQYIFFNTNEAIIANNISFTVQSVLDNNNYINKITCTNLQALCTIPQSADISTFQQTVNTINGINDKSTNICPSINELVDTQTKTQQICDNLEYQDKIKSEKIRLQRNQQYLLKLKDQQDQVDQLNQVIQDLEGKRQARAQSADQLRVLQYQKQKSDASTIRDLANQRLESQSNNQLYLDVNVNTI